MARHLAAIHVLKHKLAMSDDDYRALLLHLTGHSSAKALSASEQARVRRHLQKLAEPAQATTPDRAVWDATPMERKVWALWNQLHRDGLIRNHSAPALHAWVKRQVGVDALRFATSAQLDTLIEALKRWQQRGQEG